MRKTFSVPPLQVANWQSPTIFKTFMFVKLAVPLSERFFNLKIAGPISFC